MISTQPLASGLGVRLQGVTRSIAHDESSRAAFREIFSQHHLVVCSIDGFDDDDQRLLASALGEATIRGTYDVDPQQPGTQYVSNNRDDGILGTGRLAFHHDHLFYESPLTAIMLYAIEVPASGSVTSFRSAVDMFAALTPELRDRVGSIEGLHLYDYAKINAGQYVAWADPATASPDAVWGYKPLIWRHPASGDQMLWLSPVEGFRGIDRERGIELFEELEAFFGANADAIGRHDHHWEPGDLVVWNNLRVAHARHPFDRSEPRTLRRTPIIGDTP
jgi:alpha-ketoglutarate-dependent taurine dioxygenase